MAVHVDGRGSQRNGVRPAAGWQLCWRWPARPLPPGPSDEAMQAGPCERVLFDVVLRDAEHHELSSARQVAARLGLSEGLAQTCLERLTRERKLWIYRKRFPLYESLYGAPGVH